MSTAGHSVFQEEYSSPTAGVSTANPVEDPAGDQEVEDLQYTRSMPMTACRTPAAAWVLTTLFLLSMLYGTSSDNVICEVVGLLNAGSLWKSKQNKPDSKKLMIFCLTLAGYSWKAYSYFRNTVKNCLPCRETLRKYRNKADGSPGFSLPALKMVRNKVIKMAGD